ncbi:MAG: hydrogenase iron-sulfur subunit [Dehalococcoidia bacterium]|nr:hydrogenase iron-sulfur subunit [Dehalococcoidia bacterium]
MATIPNDYKPRITVFHCLNVLGDSELHSNGSFELRSVRMPCSSITREVYLLRAFESGSDAVILLVCPEGQCHYIEGNIRAARRVARVKKLVDEIGLDGRRLNLYNISPGDRSAVDRIIEQTVHDLAILGPNPAA